MLERRAWWTPELQRQFASEDVRVRSRRSLGDLPALLESSPHVLVLEFELAPAGCLQWLGRRVGASAELATIVIGTDRTAELEWLVRELGAVDFVMETVPGHALADLCRRQFSPAKRRTNHERRIHG